MRAFFGRVFTYMYMYGTYEVPVGNIAIACKWLNDQGVLQEVKI